MGSVDETPSLVYPPPLDPSRTSGALPSATATETNGAEPPVIELSAPILVVGGGPVGMVVSLPSP